MKKRIAQALILSIMIVSLIATVDSVWAVDDNKQVDVASKTESTKKQKLLYAGVANEIHNFMKFTYIKNADISQKVEKVYKEEYDGWTTENVNIRKEPNVESEILAVMCFNSKIRFHYYNDEWISIANNSEIAYINSKYIGEKECSYVEYSLPNNNGFKSYMSYKSITSKNSMQYKLQYNYAYTGNYGIRQVKNRYCVAIGTAFNTDIGTYIDLILENGIVIPCIISDIKADIHTESNNIVTKHNGCVSEFVVDKSCLPYKVYNNDNTGSGDISDCTNEWDSSVIKIKVYNKSIF